jgi:hypothetical protein
MVCPPHSNAPREVGTPDYNAFVRPRPGRRSFVSGREIIYETHRGLPNTMTSQHNPPCKDLCSSSTENDLTIGLSEILVAI